MTLVVGDDFNTSAALNTNTRVGGPNFKTNDSAMFSFFSSKWGKKEGNGIQNKEEIGDCGEESGAQDNKKWTKIIWYYVTKIIWQYLIFFFFLLFNSFFFFLLLFLLTISNETIRDSIVRELAQAGQIKNNNN